MSGTLGLASTPAEIIGRKLQDASVLVIDVLRATTTAATALAAGAQRVVPVAEIEDAFVLRGRLGSDRSLLCGEREGVKIAGFDLGNSPLEYTSERVGGKTVVLCSTNGTGAILRCRDAKRLAVASFVNAERAGAWLERETGAKLIVCSGKLGRTGLEDLGAGGLLVELLQKNRPELDDGARMALSVWRQFRHDPGALIRSSDHGRYLQEMGFAEDLDFCADRDRLDVLPVWRDGDLVRDE